MPYTLLYYYLQKNIQYNIEPFSNLFKCRIHILSKLVKYHIFCRNVYMHFSNNCCGLCCTVAGVLQTSLENAVVIGLSSCCHMLDRHLLVSACWSHCRSLNIEKLTNFLICCHFYNAVQEWMLNNSGQSSVIDLTFVLLCNCRGDAV